MKFKNYKDAQAYQLSEWVAGRPWHNPWTPDGIYSEELTDGECCPDFSCCGEEIWDEKARKVFVEAGDELRLQMLIGGLQALTTKHCVCGMCLGNITDGETRH